MRLVLRLAVLSVVAGVVLAVALYRNAYGNWPWNGTPEKLTWCGRTYLHESGTTGVPRPLHAVFRTPPVVGRRVYATVTVQQAERRERAGDVCGFALYVRGDGDRYAEYSLSGGP